MNNIIDIPSPINLQDPPHATQWAHEANLKRPYRRDFFQYYLTHILDHAKHDTRILELGSGPGFFAYELLCAAPHIHYTAVDFSSAMHTLALQRIASIPHSQTHFIVADFKQPHWYHVLNAHRFDYIIIHQALHELRHKAHAQHFHQSIAQHVLHPKGNYFITDHLATPDGNMLNLELYMNQTEHIHNLKQAQFKNIRIGLEIDGLCAFQATL